jgi:hypothetical protein
MPHPALYILSVLVAWKPMIAGAATAVAVLKAATWLFKASHAYATESQARTLQRRAKAYAMNVEHRGHLDIGLPIRWWERAGAEWLVDREEAEWEDDGLLHVPINTLPLASRRFRPEAFGTAPWTLG